MSDDRVMTFEEYCAEFKYQNTEDREPTFQDYCAEVEYQNIPAWFRGFLIGLIYLGTAAWTLTRWTLIAGLALTFGSLAILVPLRLIGKLLGW